ncbi:hypothetical protein M404DRAFT_647804 [Pisolithus tinctorius Marx 270]|uniref:Uncharacterized protein n=1 Tax=Pisolithus tinctorius Marx 270 TaxID=870435 RepID=A0A0C3NAF6_PISTI|nr:hypothetical protein M404DRAFT_647804 [Pisolithus tinctorius Marx 270]
MTSAKQNVVPVPLFHRVYTFGSSPQYIASVKFNGESHERSVVRVARHGFDHLRDIEANLRGS